MTGTIGGTALPSMTVVIAVYNGEKYLGATIESVLAQTHPAAEVLVINDGSTDGTASVAASFGDRVQVVNRANGGVSVARNYGISIAANELVALMDHDDLWEPNHLNNLAAAFASELTVDLCYSGSLWLVTNLSTGMDELTEPLKATPAALIYEALMERCPFVPSSVAVRKSSVINVGGFRDYSPCEDWDLWLRLLHHGARFVHVPEPTLIYRVHESSASQNPLPALRQGIRIVETDILPYLSGFRRVWHGRLVVSRLEGEAAILIRHVGMPGGLALMLRSILRHPFHSGKRYKVAAHMMLFGYRKTVRGT